MSNEVIDISGFTADGKPFIQMPERQSTGGGAMSDPVFKVQRSISELRRWGYAVPAVLGRWVDNSRVASRVPAAPAPPSATLEDYEQRLDEYIAAVAVYEQQLTARGMAVEAARGQLHQVVRDSARELLADKKLRGDFESAAAEYVEAAKLLRGVPTIQAAANADLDGTTVAAWHRRTAAGKRLSDITDTLKRFLDVMYPLGWDTRSILALVSPSADQWVANSVKGQTHVPDVCRRWEALIAAGRELKLIGSLEEYGGRLRGETDDPADAVGDPSVRVESIGVVQGRGKRLAR